VHDLRHRIRHHFQLNDRIALFLLLFQDQALQPAVKRCNKHLAPRLRTQDNRVLAATYDGAVTVYFVRYPLSILVQNVCSVHLWDLSQAQSPWLTTFSPLHPTAQASGFYRAYHNFAYEIALEYS
jgi:hypothetical protein